MLALFFSQALAEEPARLALMAGWAGNPRMSFGFASVQPALLRDVDASLVLRVTASDLHYTFLDGVHEIDVFAPGVVAGPAFVYDPEHGDFSLGVAIGLGGRYSVRRSSAGTTESGLVPDASLSGDVFWRPTSRASLYAHGKLSAADGYVWARAGGTHAVLPFVSADAPASLWLGLEATSSGTFETRLFEVGPVVEVPVRPLKAAFTLRGGASVQDMGGGSVVSGATVGATAYWESR